MKEVVKETLLELGRVIVLAVIPVLLAYFSVIDATWAVGLTVVLRVLDRGIHESGLAKKGITRF